MTEVRHILKLKQCLASYKVLQLHHHNPTKKLIFYRFYKATKNLKIHRVYQYPNVGSLVFYSEWALSRKEEHI